MGIDETLTAVGIGSLIALIIMLWTQMPVQGKRKREASARAADITARALAKFPAYQGCLALDGAGRCLFINEATRMTLVATREFAKEIPFDDYIAVNIVTDGMTTVQTRKSSAGGRAVAGGMIGGGPGALVGALSAKSVQNSVHVTSSITLVIETTDQTFPALGWNFLEPVGHMQDLKPYEVWPYMQQAAAAYNKLAPLFALHSSEQNGLVAI